MCKELSEETKLLLERYFDAAANLYGIISLKKLLEIFNMQNEPIEEVHINRGHTPNELAKMR